MTGQGFGTLLIAAGAVLAVIGLMVKYGLLGWFGHLPGDIRIKGEHGVFYFPITTMVLLSLVLSVIVNLLRKF